LTEEHWEGDEEWNDDVAPLDTDERPSPLLEARRLVDSEIVELTRTALQTLNSVMRTGTTDASRVTAARAVLALSYKSGDTIATGTNEADEAALRAQRLIEDALKLNEPGAEPGGD
jgi:hypothetical protein